MTTTRKKAAKPKAKKSAAPPTVGDLVRQALEEQVRHEVRKKVNDAADSLERVRGALNPAGLRRLAEKL